MPVEAWPTHSTQFARLGQPRLRGAFQV